MVIVNIMKMIVCSLLAVHVFWSRRPMPPGISYGSVKHLRADRDTCCKNSRQRVIDYLSKLLIVDCVSTQLTSNYGPTVFRLPIRPGKYTLAEPEDKIKIIKLKPCLGQLDYSMSAWRLTCAFAACFVVWWWETKLEALLAPIMI